MNNLYLASTRLVNPQIIESVRNFSAVDYANRIVPVLINLGFIICVIAFFLLLMIGGFQWVTSGGDKQSLENARHKLLNAFIGLMILFLLYIILRTINAFFGINIGRLGVPVSNPVPTSVIVPSPTGGGPGGPTLPPTKIGTCSWTTGCACSCPVGYTVSKNCTATAPSLCSGDTCVCSLISATTPSPTPTVSFSLINSDSSSSYASQAKFAWISISFSNASADPITLDQIRISPMSDSTSYYFSSFNLTGIYLGSSNLNYNVDNSNGLFQSDSIFINNIKNSAGSNVVIAVNQSVDLRLNFNATFISSYTCPGSGWFPLGFDSRLTFIIDGIYKVSGFPHGLTQCY